mmetsp:Transcript_886/g.1087  ORF Transcript_886/g.1087 Transcript_886/m.1087 type:complete len:200 (-) Transcript_886:46-645(-)|eukprot:CAMPEP_0170478840 /NCGR_PEP_ID=MMETSP0208-20121228/284_1 /TAXON_ID=197538 /ORGANISM="Strombidium inclinatum, Strain S3" /LENGTH=199 /DNA_ID=CAMNT_0010751161 /DNA_START=17 /DNA_END=616 /DNA_ORIENTATION=+
MKLVAYLALAAPAFAQMNFENVTISAISANSTNSTDSALVAVPISIMPEETNTVLEDQLDLMTNPEVSTVEADGNGWYVGSTTGMDETSYITEMRQVFTDYFQYALEIKNSTSDGVDCQVNKECDPGMGFYTKCCSKVVMQHPSTGMKDVSYRCMNRGVAQFNLDMTIENYSVQMQCLDNAKKLAASALAAAAVAATLF